MTNNIPQNKKLEFFQNDGNKISVTSKSPQETGLIAKVLAGLLIPGDIVCMDGDLGAGKTFFTGAVAGALDITKTAQSPTFTILIEHTDAKMPLYHFDVYRLENEDEFYDLGFDEYFFAGGICIIEWASKIRKAIPENAIQIIILRDNLEDSDTRTIVFVFPKSDDRFESFKKGLKERNDNFIQ